MADEAKERIKCGHEIRQLQMKKEKADMKEKIIIIQRAEDKAELNELRMSWKEEEEREKERR